MAPPAVAVPVEVASVAPRAHRTATIAPLRPLTRADTVARARHERRKWVALGMVVFGAPVAACIGVLEVVR